MDITVKIEDDKVTEMFNKTAEEIGSEYFAEIIKQAFSDYMKAELNFAFEAMRNQYMSGNIQDVNNRKIFAKSFIRSLFVKEQVDNYSHRVTYTPTEWVSKTMNNLDIKESMEKYRDELISTLHENIDSYMATFIKNMFINNVFSDVGFQSALHQHIDMSIQNRINMERSNNNGRI